MFLLHIYHMVDLYSFVSIISLVVCGGDRDIVHFVFGFFPRAALFETRRFLQCYLLQAAPEWLNNLFEKFQ